MIAETTLNALQDFRVEKLGTSQWCILPPQGVLEEQLYRACKKELTQGLGGVWRGGSQQMFVFDFNPTEYFNRLLSGEKINPKKWTQFFATPKEVMMELLENVYFSHTSRIMEGSGGDGTTLDAINESFQWCMENRLGFVRNEILPEMFTYELEPSRRSALEDRNDVSVLGGNYLSQVHPDCFHVVFINPPFSGQPYYYDLEEMTPKDSDNFLPEKAIGLDYEHIRKAYEDVRAGGDLVAVTMGSWITNRDKKSKAFREWLNFDSSSYLKEVRGGNPYYHWIQTYAGLRTEWFLKRLAEGSFKSSGTNIRPYALAASKGFRNGIPLPKEIITVPSDEYLPEHRRDF